MHVFVCQREKRSFEIKLKVQILPPCWHDRIRFEFTQFKGFLPAQGIDLLKEKEKYGQADETKCSESKCLLVLDLRVFRTRTEGE